MASMKLEEAFQQLSHLLPNVVCSHRAAVVLDLKFALTNQIKSKTLAS